jgi:hypothetical protein
MLLVPPLRGRAPAHAGQHFGPELEVMTLETDAT